MGNFFNLLCYYDHISGRESGLCLSALEGALVLVFFKTDVH